MPTLTLGTGLHLENLDSRLPRGARVLMLTLRKGFIWIIPVEAKWRLEMKKAFLAIITIVWSFSAFAQGPGLVTIESKYPVGETIDRFEAAAKAEKFQIFARVDFQPLAAANGGNIPPNQLLIFGRGGVVPPLLSTTPVAAIDLPLKILAWQDSNGKVWLTYNTGEFLKDRHALSGKDDLLKRLTEVTQSLAKKAVE